MNTYYSTNYLIDYPYDNYIIPYDNYIIPYDNYYINCPNTQYIEHPNRYYRKSSTNKSNETRDLTQKLELTWLKNKFAQYDENTNNPNVTESKPSDESHLSKNVKNNSSIFEEEVTENVEEPK